MSKTILYLKDISKAYPGVLALDRVSMDFTEGEVHAIVGENGAGKSTLIKTIAGAHQADSGTVTIDENEYSSLSPKESRDAGVEVIYQEFNLVDSLSAGENIFLGEKKGRFVDQKQIRKDARALFDRFKVDIDPSTLVRDLPSSMQQIVEILKAVSKNARILIMDEPTAPLTLSEVDTLFGIIKELKKQNVTVIYISHRMEEIFTISDRVSVLRDGQYISTLQTEETDKDELIALMVGRTLSEVFPERALPSQDVVLELDRVTGNGDHDISFSLNKGEILGLAGLVGAGRSELAKVIYGAEKLESGTIKINGEICNITTPSDAIRAGIGLIPENRKEEGCFLGMSIDWNVVINSVRRISSGLIVNKNREKQISVDFEKRLQIKTPSLAQKVKNLSGGNQQKVVIAKTLAADTPILIFDEPTRGIDVGAKQEIYRLMNSLVEDGHSIIMISSDMEELLGMSDRIIVLSEGRMTGELNKNDFSQHRVLELASVHVSGQKEII